MNIYTQLTALTTYEAVETSPHPFLFIQETGPEVGRSNPEPGWKEGESSGQTTVGGLIQNELIFRKVIYINFLCGKLSSVIGS